MPFAIIAGVVIVLISPFLPFTHVLNLYIFMFPLEQLFYLPRAEYSASAFFFTAVKACLQLNLVVQHIVLAIRNRTKGNYVLLGLLAAFGFYLLLPPHEFHLFNLMREAVNLLFIYVIYQERNRIDFTSFVKVLTYALVVALLLSLLKPYAGRLATLMLDTAIAEDGYPRQSILYWEVAPLIALLCLLRLYHKIDNNWFCFANAIIFVFVIRSIARKLLLATAMVYLIFGIMYLVKYKKAAIKPLLYLLLCIGIVALFSLEPLTETLSRVFTTITDETNKGNVVGDIGDIENIEQIIQGEVTYDPGRIGLWKLYAKTIFTSPLTLFFGKGLGASWIGQMQPHNIILYLLYRYGLIGVLFMIAIILWCVSFRNLKFNNLRRYYPLLIFLIPTLFSFLIDTTPIIPNYNFWLFVIIACQFIYQQLPTTPQTTVKPVPATTPPTA